MAAPPRTPQEIASQIHNSQPGQSAGGWTLVSKSTLVDQGGMLKVEAVVQRGGNTWTAYYTTQADGTLGKIYYVIDDNGVKWRGWADGTWTDEGAV